MLTAAYSKSGSEELQQAGCRSIVEHKPVPPTLKGRGQNPNRKALPEASLLTSTQPSNCSQHYSKLFPVLSV